MGLDVHLYELNEGVTREQLERATAAYDAAQSAFYSRSDYKDLTDAEKDAAKAKWPPDPEGDFDFKRDGGPMRKPGPLAQMVELDYPEDPSHYFKIGYWRSSYNAGGINNVLQNMGLPTLYTIAYGTENPEEESVSYLDWAAVAERAAEVLRAYVAKRERVGGVWVDVAGPSLFGDRAGPTSEAEALAIYEEEKRQHDEKAAENKFGFESYENAKGAFHFGTGLVVRAVIPGRQKMFRNERVVSYLICDTAKEEADWYETALKIVAATARHALDSGHPERFYVHWSG